MNESYTLTKLQLIGFVFDIDISSPQKAASHTNCVRENVQFSLLIFFFSIFGFSVVVIAVNFLNRESIYFDIRSMNKKNDCVLIFDLGCEALVY